ncbi:cell division protein FtsQ [Bacteroidia bacterium]|nr:cell division protein FtsQ [Bacteroidia bacterium]
MNEKTKKIGIIAALIVALVLILQGITMCNKKHRERLCNDIQIRISRPANVEVFIVNEDIDQALNGLQLQPIGQVLDGISTITIEQALRANSAIKDVQVYSQINGNLCIDIEQHQPIARIETRQHQQCYITKAGTCMATRKNFAARVMIVNGAIDEPVKINQNILLDDDKDSIKQTSLLKEIYAIASHIDADEFLRALIDQIYVLPNREYEIVSKINNQVIVFGAIDNLEEKFQRLKWFYKYGIRKSEWNYYKTINLKFNGQVVCTKS